MPLSSKVCGASGGRILRLTQLHLESDRSPRGDDGEGNQLSGKPGNVGEFGRNVMEMLKERYCQLLTSRLGLRSVLKTAAGLVLPSEC